ncbi:hypothetical protein BpHYR1_035784 [Brachionus plicatilis]|uniref:Uncharacterized protein n=1 Tax=Brachionus plicatilis TaxID=10195 RepID=A0A3M7RFD6_BRAPC|nr:hypothetical protein BpHYR1_035784 [Brachionus plicatilis]
MSLVKFRLKEIKSHHSRAEEDAPSSGIFIKSDMTLAERVLQKDISCKCRVENDKIRDKNKGFYYMIFFMATTGTKIQNKFNVSETCFTWSECVIHFVFLATNSRNIINKRERDAQSKTKKAFEHQPTDLVNTGVADIESDELCSDQQRKRLNVISQLINMNEDLPSTSNSIKLFYAMLYII